MTEADKEAREHLQKLVNGNVSDSDTSLFDSHFSYENKEPKSEEERKTEMHRTEMWHPLERHGGS